MTGDKSYPPEHWLLDANPQALLASAQRQQSLAYSRVKNTFLFELMGELSGATVLDYGCGAGWLATQAARRGAAHVVGADRLSAPLAAARLLAERDGVSDRCHFLQVSSPEALAEVCRFDAILLRDVLEHVEDDIGLLSRLAGLLKSGGRLVLATQNSRSLNYLLEGSIRRVLLGQRDWLGWDPTHLRFYTPATLARALERAGLDATAWRSAYLVPNKIPAPRGLGRQYLRLEQLSVLDRVLGRLPGFSRLGYSLMVRAERTT